MYYKPQNRSQSPPLTSFPIFPLAARLRATSQGLQKGHGVGIGAVLFESARTHRHGVCSSLFCARTGTSGFRWHVHSLKLNERVSIRVMSLANHTFSGLSPPMTTTGPACSKSLPPLPKASRLYRPLPVHIETLSIFTSSPSPPSCSCNSRLTTPFQPRSLLRNGINAQLYTLLRAMILVPPLPLTLYSRRDLQPVGRD